MKIVIKKYTTLDTWSTNVCFFFKIKKNTNTYTQNHADVCPFLDDGS